MYTYVAAAIPEPPFTSTKCSLFRKSSTLWRILGRGRQIVSARSAAVVWPFWYRILRTRSETNCPVRPVSSMVAGAIGAGASALDGAAAAGATRSRIAIPHSARSRVRVSLGALALASVGETLRLIRSLACQSVTVRSVRSVGATIFLGPILTERGNHLRGEPAKAGGR